MNESETSSFPFYTGMLSCNAGMNTSLGTRLAHSRTQREKMMTHSAPLLAFFLTSCFLGMMMAADGVAVSNLRESVRPTYPEIDRLYSDDYLAAVLSVPDRPYEYARDEKIGKALEWRQSYDVDSLIRAFRCDETAGGIFRLITETASDGKDGNGGCSDNLPPFVPSRSLVDVCLSGAFCFGGFDKEGRGILVARTALLDWWKTGVEDGIRYHVLVIEYALRMMSEERSKKSSTTTTSGSCRGSVVAGESIVIHVDTSGLSLVPPPLGTLTGFAGLMQRAYPDRIHRIIVGPVNPVLRRIFDAISPYLRPRSRDKIALLEDAPSKDSEL